jgi:cysteine desulfurase
MRLPVYLDNNATTPLDPRVLEAMLPYLTQHFGNAASRSHEYGWMAEAAVDVARRQVAGLVGADTNEIIFTSGATESINLAIKGIVEGARRQSGQRELHIVTVATEHHAVLDAVKALTHQGVQHTVVAVDGYGRVDPAAVERAIGQSTVLVSVMWANNEIGTLAPVDAIGEICRGRGVLFHSDATQAVGKTSVDVHALSVDLVSFSAHKMYGPKGAGALYIRKRSPAIPLVPQIDGGGHESGLRSGTLNVPAIVGFGKAAMLAADDLAQESRTVSELRDLLENLIFTNLPGVHINGHPTERLGNTSSLTFAGKRADGMILAMRDVAVSTGSACSSASPGPSHVLQAIGLPPEDVRSTIRFAVGRFTTEEEIRYAARRVIEVAKQSQPRIEMVHSSERL